MLGDGEIREAALARGLHHFGQSIVAIGGDGVGVQVAPEIFELDEFGQLTGGSGFDLAAVLAQLGRDIRKADGTVYFRLGLAGDSAILSEPAVFIDLQAAPLSESADGNAVSLAAGEIMQCRAITLCRDNPQIDLKTRFECDRRAGFAVSGDLLDLLIFGEALDYRCTLCGRDKNIDVANGLLVTPVASRDDGRLDLRRAAQPGEQWFDVAFGDH